MKVMQSIKGIAVCAAIPFMSVVPLLSEAIEFSNPSQFNPVWESARPGSSIDKTIPTEALLGNGSLGVVNGGDGNCKKFVLTRGDLWSCGRLTSGNTANDITPISFADFEIIPGPNSVKSTDILDLPIATLRTEGIFGKSHVKMESFVSSDDDLFIITGVCDSDDTWTLRLVAHNGIKEFPRQAGVSNDGFWVRRSTLNLLPQGDTRGWVTNATAAVSVLGAQLEGLSSPNCGESKASLKIFAGKPFALIVSSSCDKRYTWNDIEKHKQSHVAWWTKWWGCSRIATGDTDLDRFYLGQVYLLGAGVRAGKFPPGLYGIWVTTDKPGWHNDFHLNYNYIATWYGCFAANRCEVAESMPDPLIDYLPQAMRNAKDNLNKIDRCFGCFFKNTRAYLDRRNDLKFGIDDAALYPVSLGPWGTAPEGDGTLWSQISDGAFQCALMCTHWEYTHNRDYLKKVWPVLDKTANFFLKWCEKESLPNGTYRYVVWDSQWEGSGVEKNSAPAVACLKHILSTLIAVVDDLRLCGIEVSKEKIASWKELNDHLSELPVGVYPINGKDVAMLSGVEKPDGKANPSGGNAVNLESVIPGEAFSFDITDSFKTLATNAVNGNIALAGDGAWSGINQTPKLFATAIRTGYPAQAVIDAFKKHQLSRMQKNFHIRDGVHGVEKIGSMEFVNSMFIQCDHGIVKVFPNWTSKDAKFENLRAKGCFLVSAEMRGAKVVRVEITSEKGGVFRLVDPFDGKKNFPGWSRCKTRNSGEATLERNFIPGEKIILEIN